MKSIRTTTDLRPIQGWAAFVHGYRAVNMKPMGMEPIDSPLDRDENTPHPGEGCA